MTTPALLAADCGAARSAAAMFRAEARTLRTLAAHEPDLHRRRRATGLAARIDALAQALDLAAHDLTRARSDFTNAAGDVRRNAALALAARARRRLSAACAAPGA